MAVGTIRACHRGTHAAELRPPLVERGGADAMGSAQLRNRRTQLGLLEHGDDLAVTETRFFSGNLLGSDYEKIPHPTAADLRGASVGQRTGVHQPHLNAPCSQLRAETEVHHPTLTDL